MIKKLFTSTIFLFLGIILFAQDTIPTNYFRSPLGIPLYLAGNFGELRSNHFHSGLDMKTQGREGFNIYAAAEGYVSRIKISPWGYGKTIYIDHPNGYTTVYAHLKSFKGKISKLIKEYQYKKESWEIDWYPSDTLMKVKKSDIIALSGNTGGSGGPHLHFEIRETKSEHPVNPLLFGFKIKDNIKPIIKSIAVFPLNDTSFVNGKRTTQRFTVIGANGNYKLKTNSTLSVYGEIGIGIETIDKLNDVHNRNGIYTVQLSSNNNVIYQSEMKKFSFDESSYINSLIDYETFLRKKIRIRKSFIEPNNQLSIYKKEQNNGVLSFSSNQKSTLNYLVKDTYGNSSTLSFNLVGKKQTSTSNVIKLIPDTIFDFNIENSFADKNVKVTIPKNALYKNLPFTFSIGDTIKGAITPTYNIHSEYTPLDDKISVSIKKGRLSDKLREKAVIVHIDRKKRVRAKGGVWKKNFLTIKNKSFGAYAIMIDSIPPKITPINISPNKNMINNSAIVVKIADNLSGIKSFRGTIDGKWILMEYEAKKAKLFYTFKNITKGKHNFELLLTDGVGNTSKISIPFTR